ncbi:hypothetical protein pb186bvf_019916 [Paramecium bursaria]
MVILYQEPLPSKKLVAYSYQTFIHFQKIIYQNWSQKLFQIEIVFLIYIAGQIQDRVLEKYVYENILLNKNPLVLRSPKMNQQKSIIQQLICLKKSHLIEPNQESIDIIQCIQQGINQGILGYYNNDGFSIQSQDKQININSTFQGAIRDTILRK